jgi:catechol 2,3-dioxygenase-like lactoylglutathione lyase family enzyme/predicted enzyme related to lactoylglutathione lyase
MSGVIDHALLKIGESNFHPQGVGVSRWSTQDKVGDGERFTAPREGAMRQKKQVWVVAVAVAMALGSLGAANGQTANMRPPLFHHLHLNSVDPDAALAFYTAQFSTTSKASWAGLPALKSPNDVMVLFTKVAAPPTIVPQSAYWHFGWHVPDVRKSLATYQSRPEVKLLPLYTTDEGGFVFVSSDTWPGTGGVLGLTKAQIAAAKAEGIKPAGGAGFAYMQGPDNAIVEYQGNMPAERFNHVHLYQEDPFCAQLWYQKHLGGTPVASRAPGPARTDANCKVERSPDRTWPALQQEGMFRVPTAAVTFGDVALTWYANPGDKPLASSRGQLYDHIALSVSDLDAWVAKLRGEGVTVLEAPYKLGDTRAAMIEGPSREAIELVEVR